MIITFQKHQATPIHKALSMTVALAFSLSMLMPPQAAYAQMSFALPNPGVMVNLSTVYTPPMIRGLTIHPKEPFKFDFIVDNGDSGLGKETLKDESSKLIKYFLASLTVPEDELWVNLSPYEKDRIIPKSFGVTEMGRDLLSQDFMLKQISASLMHPENKLGEEFWERVFKRAYEVYGTTEIPINTFNKIWIVPDTAVVYQSGNTAFVAESHLKVMLESDYLALKENLNEKEKGTDQVATQDAKNLSDLSSEVVREILIPEIEKEVNQRQNFANLRQIYHSMILATWYKKTLKRNILAKVYANKNKVVGIDVSDKEISKKIYQKYLAAFKKGVYDFIREDYDPASQEMIPRRYFSGGCVAVREEQLEVETDLAMLSGDARDGLGDLRDKGDGVFRVQGDFRPPQGKPLPSFIMQDAALLTTAEEFAPVLNYHRTLVFSDDPDAIDDRLVKESEAKGKDYLRVTISDQSDLDRLITTVTVQNGDVDHGEGRLMEIIKKGGTLLVDYTGSDPKLVEGFNSLFDRQPYFRTAQASRDLNIIGVIKDDQVADYPVSFYSRFNNIVSAKLPFVDPIESIKPATEEIENAVVLDLWGSSQIREQLIGNYYIDEVGAIRVKEGALVKAIEENSPLIIRGANWKNKGFTDTLRQILVKGTFDFNGKSYSVPDDFKVYSEEVEYSLDGSEKKIILPEESESKESAWVINRETQDFLFARAHVSSERKFVQKKGLLELEGIALRVTDQLEDWVWHHILHSPNVLTVEVLPHVVVPSVYASLRSDKLKRSAKEIPKKPWDEAKKEKVVFVEGEDLSFIRNNVAEDIPSEDVVFYPITAETSLDQLTSSVEIETDEGELKFRTQTKGVIEALQEGKTVVLDGLDVNESLMRDLESTLQDNPYIIDNGERVNLNDLSGRLILTSKPKPIMALRPQNYVKMPITDEAAAKILKQRHGDRFQEADFKRILQLRDIFKTMPAPLKPGLYPEVLNLSLSRMDLLFKYDNWLEAFESVLIAHYVEDAEVSAFMRSVVRLIFGIDYTVQKENTIHGKKLSDILNKIAENNGDGHFWQFVDTLSLDLLQHDDLKPQLRFAQVRTKREAVFNILRKSLVKKYKDQGDEERENYYRFVGAQSGAVDNAPNINDQLGSMEGTWMERREQVVKALRKTPAVMLQGSPGTGKSFITDEISKALGYRNGEVVGPLTVGMESRESDIVSQRVFEDGKTTYFNENVAEWASLENGGLLIVDEANLPKSGSFWNFLRGLFAEEPYVWIDGQRKMLSERHRVIFTGNQNYLPGRRSQDIADDFMLTVHFPRFTPKFFEQQIREYIPDLKTNHDELLDLVLDLHLFFQQMNPDVDFSLRDIQEFSARVNLFLGVDWSSEDVVAVAWDIYKGNFTAEEKDAFRHLIAVKYGVLIHEKEEARIEALRQDKAERYLQQDGVGSISLVPSTAELVASIEDFMKMREWRIQEEHEVPGKSIPGKRGIIFEGPSGRGKDITVLKALDSMKFGEANTVSGVFKILEDHGHISAEKTGEIVTALIEAGLFSAEDASKLGFAKVSRKISHLESGRYESFNYSLKEEDVLKILRAKGLLTESSSVEETIRTKKYYRLNASIDYDQIVQTIQSAQSEGSVVIISEMNLLPSGFLEGKLNDVLTGNAHEGFALVATMNSSDYSGREKLSTALQNRVVYRRMSDYTEEEMVDIAKDVIPGTLDDQRKIEEADIKYAAKAHKWIKDHIDSPKHMPTIREFLQVVLRSWKTDYAGVRRFQADMLERGLVVSDPQSFVKPVEENIQDVYGPLYLDKILKGKVLPSRNELMKYQGKAEVDTVTMLKRLAGYIVPRKFGPVGIHIDKHTQTAGAYYKFVDNSVTLSASILAEGDGNWMDPFLHESSHGLFTRNFPGFRSLAFDEFDPVYNDLEDIRHERAFRHHFPYAVLGDPVSNAKKLAAVILTLDVKELHKLWSRPLYRVTLRQMFQYALNLYVQGLVSKEYISAFSEVIESKQGMFPANPFKLVLAHLDTAKDIVDSIPLTLEEEDISFKQYRALNLMQSIRTDFLSIPQEDQRIPQISDREADANKEKAMDVLQSAPPRPEKSISKGQNGSQVPLGGPAEDAISQAKKDARKMGGGLLGGGLKSLLGGLLSGFGAGSGTGIFGGGKSGGGEGREGGGVHFEGSKDRMESEAIQPKPVEKSKRKLKQKGSSEEGDRRDGRMEKLTEKS